MTARATTRDARRGGRHPNRGGVTLAAALATVVVAAALAAAVAEVTRAEILIARHRRATVLALAATDACLARVVAALPPGWDFGPTLAGADGAPGTADDGRLETPPGCVGSARPAPGPADPPRMVVTLAASAGGGRRVLDALVGRGIDPAVPALLWLGSPAPARGSGRLALDGGDGDPGLAPWAALAAPADPALLDGWAAAGTPPVAITPGTGPPIAAPAPPVAALAARLAALGAAGAETLGPAGGSSPTLTHVTGDLVVTDVLRGAGLLLVDGTLDIRGTLDFSGVVVAASGLRVAGGGRLAVAGAVWTGPGGVPGPALVIDGTLEVRGSGVALADVDGLLALPRAARLLGLRDVG
jgi:hypothetical protein